MLQVAVLREFPEDPEVALSWNTLVRRLERPEIFFTYEWALAANRAFSDTTRPLIILVYDAQQLCGVAALATHREPDRSAFFLTGSTADYCDIVTNPSMTEDVLAAIFREIQQAGVQDLVLANIPSDSPTLRELPVVARTLRYRIHSRPAYECGLILFGTADERHATLQLVKRKDREKRGLKKMAQLGPVQLTHLTPEQTAADLTAIFSAQISRFLATHRVSPMLQPERRSFLTQLSHLLDQSGWLKISRLEVNGKAVAWNYGFRFCESWFWYLPTFELQYEYLSPGSCLLRLLVEEGCEDQSLKRLDLGLGDEAYKERFANAVCPTTYVHLSTGLVRHGKVLGRHWLAHTVKRFPKIEACARKARELSRNQIARMRDQGLTRTAQHAFQRATRHLISDDKILLFQFSQVEVPGLSAVTLHPLDWKLIANAAIRNADDMPTIQYLMRCAERLKHKSDSGFALVGHDGDPKHFLWIDNYNGFYVSEIDHKLGSSEPDGTVIFDCWTPTAHRGQGYYAAAIRLAANTLARQEKSAWIFSAIENTASVRGIRSAGFTLRRSLVRKRRFGRSSITTTDIS